MCTLGNSFFITEENIKYLRIYSLWETLYSVKVFKYVTILERDIDKSIILLGCSLKKSDFNTHDYRMRY